MEIFVKRHAKKLTYTIGKMFINGEYFCDTLEDRDRELSDKMTEDRIRQLKVYGKTAIPTGTYRISVERWMTHPEYEVPMLHGVKGFSGILIHNGSNDTHTLGCILVGKNKVRGSLSDSKKYMLDLTAKCKEALFRNEKIYITIE